MNAQAGMLAVMHDTSCMHKNREPKNRVATQIAYIRVREGDACNLLFLLNKLYFIANKLKIVCASIFLGLQVFMININKKNIFFIKDFNIW